MLAADAQDRIVALIEVMEPFVSLHPPRIQLNSYHNHTETPLLSFPSLELCRLVRPGDLDKED